MNGEVAELFRNSLDLIEQQYPADFGEFHDCFRPR